MARLSYSIVVLTFNRNQLLAQLVVELEKFAQAGVEIIVVDNCSDEPAKEVTGLIPWIRNIRTSRNIGASGRNLGIDAATGDIIICLDDDISGLTVDVLEKIDVLFGDPLVAAVNFKVLDQGTHEIVNWVHHRDVQQFSEVSFDTYEITEGAVAFRRLALQESGGYAGSFFLSHEGPDLAFRLMNNGLRVLYSPEISVIHSFAAEGRTSWRNYYFDTRNTIWLAIRNLPLVYGTKIVLRQSIAMLIYAIRDGYVRWWFKGIVDGIGGVARERRGRRCLSSAAFERVKAIDKFRPSFLYMLRQRLFRRDLKL